MKEELQRILDGFKGEIKALFELILEDDTISINKKVNLNTLIDSNLYKDIKVERSEFTFILYYNFYGDYIESGRKPFARKVPINAIIEWMRRKNISNDIRVAYAIRESIFKQGIKPRPILSTFDKEIDELVLEYMDKIFDALTIELDKYFSD